MIYPDLLIELNFLCKIWISGQMDTFQWRELFVIMTKAGVMGFCLPIHNDWQALTFRSPVDQNERDNWQAGSSDVPYSSQSVTKLPSAWLQNQLFLTITEKRLTLGNTEVVRVTRRG